MSEALYDRLGVRYGRGRRPDPRWPAAVDAALDTARTVLNVGAGTGSYEPADRYVVAVEPSWTMIDQRPDGAAPVLQPTAEQLPVANGRFEVAMALVTLRVTGPQACARCSASPTGSSFCTSTLRRMTSSG